jgi:hypothetical protein
VLKYLSFFEISECRFSELTLYMERIENTSLNLAVNILIDEGNKLGRFIDDLTPRKSDQDGSNWLEYRAFAITRYGDESITMMIPTSVNCNTRFLTRSFNLLRQLEIHTKDDLMNVNFRDPEIMFKRGMGDKTVKFGILLQNVAIAEKYVEWNSYNKPLQK